LSQGEEKENGRNKKYILADAFESFIGALYLDQGYSACKNFIEKTLIKPKLEEIISKKTIQRPEIIVPGKSPGN
jgi:ribonuclease-3